MAFTKIRWLVIVVIAMTGIAVNVCAFTRAGEVTVRKAVRLATNWKFYKGAPTGNAYDNAYNDASWAPVCVPHTIDTLAPTQAAEAGSYVGTAWYRRQIQVAGGTDKKYFLDFEGAMQTADVWVNGVSVGRHDNSGYTGFSFDITSQLGTATAAALAVKLDNTKSADIPPGRTDNGPDFFLFSGLYRNVWLVTTGKIYIPFCGQFISTSSGTATCKTTVKNETSAAASCKVDITVQDKSGAIAATGTLTQSVPANGSSVFNVSAVVASPQLWSPETPNLYRVYTTVTVGGIVVDDYAARFGFRTLAWSNTNGFSLNGSRYEIKGTCYHQFFAWVQNAVPNSRWPIDIAMIKDAGFNAVRLSHYPRNPAFYDAADSMGILLLAEVPTWCYGLYSTASFTTAYWNRLYACAREMVTQGYNHPSIFLWGLSNELLVNVPTEIGRINDTVHAIDNTRHTILANNGFYGHSTIPDVAGLNYMTLTNVTDANMKVVATEYSYSWSYSCARGTASCQNGNGLGSAGWGYWTTLAGQAPRMAGAFLWVFNDYFALWNQNSPMGLVDEYRLPKQGYYLYRKNYTGKADDYEITGTATKIVLTADITQLQADGSDFTLITAALRNNANACINSTANITFSVNGPVTPLGPTTLAAAAGKIGLILRSTTTAGTIIVSANSTGLPQANDTITSVLPQGTVGIVNKPATLPFGHTIGEFGKTNNRVTIVDINGRIRKTTSSERLRGLSAGVYIIRFEKDGATTYKKLVRMAQ
jgi:beta-galactosidase